MNNGPVAGERGCARCGAGNPPDATVCWLCLQPIAAARTEGDAIPASAQSPAPAPPAYGRWTFSLESIFLVITLIAVCLGALSQYPGLGVPMAIVALPALVRTTMVVQRRQGGGNVSAATKIALFLGSFAVTAVICTVVCITAVVAFCGTACGILAAGGFAGGVESLSIGIGLLAASVASVGIVIPLSRWVRTRWKRDIRPDR